MTFLQPLILLALPLVALPVLVHVLNQRRHKPINWGAMLFIRQARKANRGFTTLRRWIILALRMLAIAALVVAVSRPLASDLGGLSFDGGRRNQIVLLDRSPSMEHRDPNAGKTRRETALERLQEMFSHTGRSGSRTLIESATMQPLLLDDGVPLTELQETSATAAAADIPAMMMAALDYLETNSLSPTDIWICSDLQQTDWNTESGRWAEIRDRLTALPGVRCEVLAYSERDEFNLSVSVDNVERFVTQISSELRLDVKVTQTGGAIERRTIPLAFEIGGLRSTIEVEINGRHFRREGLSISLDEGAAAGAGFVQLPADANLADNRYYFAFSEPPVQRSVVVSDEPVVTSLLQLAAQTPSSRGRLQQCEILPSARSHEIDWEQVGLILWHAPLPDGLLAKQLDAFVASGRTVIFFPVDGTPSNTAAASNEPQLASQSFCNVSWEAWTDSRSTPETSSQPTNDSAMRIGRWRTDSDLLRSASSGEPLPWDKFVAWRRRAIVSKNATPLASFEDGAPLVLRANTDGGAVYFCATLPLESHSTLTQDGIALYIMIQRALEQGSQLVGQALNLTAGQNVPSDIEDWTSLNPKDQPVLLSERHVQPGVYEQNGRFVALNRPDSEDRPSVLGETELEKVLGGTSYQIIHDRLGELRSLASEMWRVFIVVVIIALIAEGAISLPNQARSKSARIVFTNSTASSGTRSTNPTFFQNAGGTTSL